MTRTVSSFLRIFCILCLDRSEYRSYCVFYVESVFHVVFSRVLCKSIFPKHLNSDFISPSFRNIYTVCVILIFLLNRRKYCKDQIQQRRLTACLKETRRLLLHQLSLSSCCSLLLKTCIPTFLVKQHNTGARTASKDVGKVKAKTQKLEKQERMRGEV